MASHRFWGPWLVMALLLLPGSPSSGCPAVCTCFSGEVNCLAHGLRDVPDNLPANATTLLLDYNRLAVLRNRTFLTQSALRHLSLRSNVLVSIQGQALVGLRELQELVLIGNYLSVLQPETFLPVPSLTALSLGHNRLLTLEPEVLRATPHLQTLDIHGNALPSLPAGLLENLPALRYVRLDDNPWMCSCGIHPLFHWLLKNMDKVPGEMGQGKGGGEGP